MSQSTVQQRTRTTTTETATVARKSAAKPRSLSRLRLLRQGVRGAQVKLLTQKLAKAGYLDKPTDKFDGEVAAAVKKYQKEKGLQVDGIVGQQTWGSFYGMKVPPGSNLLNSGGSSPGSSSGVGAVGGRGRRGGAEAVDSGPVSGGTRVTAYVNGRAQQISVVDAGGGEKLRADAAKNYKSMLAAARRAGVNLSSTSGFRTMGEQQALYQRYLNGTGNLAAKPGYSNHQNGISMDIGGISGYGSRAYQWLQGNAGRYGFSNDVRGEPWHWTYRG